MQKTFRERKSVFMATVDHIYQMSFYITCPLFLSCARTSERGWSMCACTYGCASDWKAMARSHCTHQSARCPWGWCHWHRARLVADWTEGTNSHYLPSRFIGLPRSYFTLRDMEGKEGGREEGERWRHGESGSDRVFTDKSPRLTIHSLKKTLLAISTLSSIRYQCVFVCVCVRACARVCVCVYAWVCRIPL